MQDLFRGAIFNEKFKDFSFDLPSSVEFIESKHRYPNSELIDKKNGDTLDGASGKYVILNADGAPYDSFLG